MFIDSLTVQGDVTFEKPLSVNDTEGVGLQMVEENGILLSTKDFPPLGSITFKDNVKVKKMINFFILEILISLRFFLKFPLD